MIPTQPASIPSLEPIPALDGLRGFAVLVVLAFHTLPVTDQSSSTITLWNGIAKSCWVGVDLFFVLSGFDITAVLLKSTGDPTTSESSTPAAPYASSPFTVLFGLIYLVPYMVPNAALPPLYHWDNALG